MLGGGVMPGSRRSAPGNQPSRKKPTYRATSAIQNVGIEMPASEATRRTWSAGRLRRSAAITPNAMPDDRREQDRVERKLGRRGNELTEIVASPGRASRVDCPRSPCTR